MKENLRTINQSFFACFCHRRLTGILNFHVFTQSATTAAEFLLILQKVAIAVTHLDCAMGRMWAILEKIPFCVLGFTLLYSEGCVFVCPLVAKISTCTH